MLSVYFFFSTTTSLVTNLGCCRPTKNTPRPISWGPLCCSVWSTLINQTYAVKFNIFWKILHIFLISKIFVGKSNIKIWNISQNISNLTEKLCLTLIFQTFNAFWELLLNTSDFFFKFKRNRSLFLFVLHVFLYVCFDFSLYPFNGFKCILKITILVHGRRLKSPSYCVQSSNMSLPNIWIQYTYNYNTSTYILNSQYMNFKFCAHAVKDMGENALRKIEC